jgi:pimeloyl-ACP methyl ester carboxylesterase
MNVKHGYLFFLVMLVVSACGPRTLPQTLQDQHACQIAGQDAICGVLPVYENRVSQSGRVIDLYVAVIKASSPNPLPDPIFFLAGGPGEAATTTVGNIQFIGWVAEGRRDIVLVDQRGTGNSHEVVAPPSPDFSGLSPEESEKQLAAWIDRTLASLDMDVRYYTTSVAMDDLDAVRQALGYDKINLIGTSYGATAAQYYLRQHEDHVRTAVLIVGSLLDTPVFELEAGNAQLALDRAFEQCESDAACQAAYPNLRSEFSALLDRLNQQPVEVTLETGTVILTRDYFAAKVEWLTRDSQRTRSLPFWIHQAYENNDWNVFAEADVHTIGSKVMSYSIRCSEKWASFTPDAVMQYSADSYLFEWSLSQAQQTALVCKYIPHGETPEGTLPQPASQKPVLLFNGAWDILDPPTNVAGAAELWPNSLSLTLPWQSHEISDTSTALCMKSIVQDFVDQESTEHLETSCLQKLPAPFFRIK